MMHSIAVREEEKIAILYVSTNLG